MLVEGGLDVIRQGQVALGDGGSLDEIRVYDTALTVEQISRLAADSLVAPAGKMSARNILSLAVAPNPFNPSVQIRLDGMRGYGEVSIYASSGKQAARLALTHGRAVWDAGKMPSGVYLIQARAGKEVFRTKAVLIK